MRSHRTLAVLGAALLALPLVAACGSGTENSSASADSGKVAITATDSACDIAKTDFQPGDVTFALHNKGGAPPRSTSTASRRAPSPRWSPRSRTSAPARPATCRSS
ncbi:hypothetical protein ACFQ0T_41115 [Kitasatospora gansuensis]